MNEQESSDPVMSLIRAARPEMERQQESAELSFETRLREALEEQSVPWAGLEANTSRVLRFAAALTVLILLQAALWFASQSGNYGLHSQWTLERILIGI
jgi:hypothetical protein